MLDQKHIYISIIGLFYLDLTITGAGGEASTSEHNRFDLNDQWDPKDFEPTDNSFQSVLSSDPKFSERFMKNYSKWLRKEVYSNQIDWDFLLSNTRGLLVQMECF